MCVCGGGGCACTFACVFPVCVLVHMRLMRGAEEGRSPSHQMAHLCVCKLCVRVLFARACVNFVRECAYFECALLSICINVCSICVHVRVCVRVCM